MDQYITTTIKACISCKANWFREGCPGLSEPATCDLHVDRVAACGTIDWVFFIIERASMLLY
jgi:hypothetical protein